MSAIKGATGPCCWAGRSRQFCGDQQFYGTGGGSVQTGGLALELSFGTHFFLDLVETDIFYLAIYPEHDNCFFNKGWLDRLPNAMEELVPSGRKYKHVVKVCDVPGKGLQLMADVVSQKILCFQ